MDKITNVPQQEQFWESFGKSGKGHGLHILELPAQTLQSNSNLASIKALINREKRIL